MDEGHLTDGHGRKVDFRNCLVVLTSNLGSRVISEDAADARRHEADVHAGMGVAELPDAAAARMRRVREGVM